MISVYDKFVRENMEVSVAQPDMVTMGGRS